jgi:hypothetical protein
MLIFLELNDGLWPVNITRSIEMGGSFCAGTNEVEGGSRDWLQSNIWTFV